MRPPATIICWQPASMMPPTWVGTSLWACPTSSLEGAKMAKSPKELLYYIVEGEMTVITDDGIQHVLHAGDSIHMSPDQGRESKNTGSTVAKMLVISYLA